MAELTIAPVTARDLPVVAAIHARAFADSAITAFGPEAVRRYYHWLLEGPHDARLMGAWQGERLVGFCAAGHFHGAMNGFLRANRRYLAWRVATHPQLLTSPLIRERMRSALRITVQFSRRRQAAAPPVSAAPHFGILAIATDPVVRGTGAGRALMLEAEARARSRGIPTMTLTVHTDNARAIRFYEQLGWQRDEPWTGCMTKPL